MPEITIKIKDKRPILLGDVKSIVADNSDYTIRFTFDEQWDDKPKTVFFVRSNGYAFAPVLTVGDEVSVPIQSDVGTFSKLYVGVQQGDVKTSRACEIVLLPAITDCIEDHAVQPDPDMWEDIVRRLMETEYMRDEAKEAKEAAESARDDAALSERNSAASAQSASGSAGIALESAKRAETAQSAVEAHKNEAAQSAANAKTSETNAAESAEAAAQSADRAEQVAVANGYMEFELENEDGILYLVRTDNIVDEVDFELNEETGLLEVIIE